MTLLYINYWSVGSPLTEATVFPNLIILRKYFSKIYLATVERGSLTKSSSIPENVIHVPFQSADRLPRVFCKIHDLVFYTITLLRLVRNEKPDVVICRGSMAGIFGVVINRVFGVPFFVESFEPHAEYMVNGGVWKKASIEYRFQLFIEEETKRRARWLMPVSYNYETEMISDGVSKDKICTMPCCVNLSKFAFSLDARHRVRKQLMIPSNAMVGIYAGKFGGIYLDDEAFVVFRQCFELLEDFFLIVLTSNEKKRIEAQLTDMGIDDKKYFVDKVSHAEVADFLSASDFGFSLVKTSASSRFCSPVKNGEYWANGLPILSPEGIGDDASIISETGAGVLFTWDSLPAAIAHLNQMHKIGRQELNEKIHLVAQRYRNFDIIKKSYEKLFTKYRS